MRLLRGTLIVSMLALLGAGLLPAQTVTGTLSGHVADATGAVMPGIKVTARSQQTDMVREAVTNTQGFYEMSFMPLGSYELIVTATGFQGVKKSGVLIELNKTTVSDFSLNPSTVSSTVEVTGEIPLIDTTQGEVKHSLEAKQIEDTPLAGRNFMSLVEQIPGFQNVVWIDSSNNPTNSTGSYAAFSGLGSRSATFQIDGVNNDDSSENQNRQGVNISSIAQFQVLTNSYSAQFGRAGGAVILVQTKSGSNKIHGDAYDFIQNDFLNANGFFSNSGGVKRQRVRRDQYGGTVGAPLIKDKLFFFGSGERVWNTGKGTMSRFVWLPSDGPRACNPGETPKPGGPYCVDPATHPHIDRDLKWMKSIMDLWNTDELKGKQPNDPVGCADMIASGRPNRCVRVGGLSSSSPDSDYSGKFDWNAPRNTNVALRYQYSRQQRYTPRIIKGDNYGVNNNRQYNIGLTATHVFSPRQTGEFRYGFGNRSTLQDVTDGNTIPTVRFSSVLYDPALSSDTLAFGGTIIGTSTNVPINRRQHDNQFVYNHTYVMSKHTLRMGVDERFLLLDDLTGDRARGYWTFGTNSTLAQIRALQGYTGWENFLIGYVTGYQQGYGNPYAQNRYSETNLYFEDDYRVRRNFTLNLGVRWEGVGGPREAKNRFSYGFGGDYNNIEPRFGFAYQPVVETPWLKKVTGGPGQFVIRGGWAMMHSRIFQSIFSQNQASIRTQPPNGYAASFGGISPYEISDPSNGFTWTQGMGTTYNTAYDNANGVRIKGGQRTNALIVPDPHLQMPYAEQWNLTISRQLPKNMAIDIIYNGNRGIGNLFYDYKNLARFPIESQLLSADVGGSNFKPVLFDRVCNSFTDPICQTLDANGNVVIATSGPLKTFSALSSTTATLAQKGIVIESGVPHGYISSNTTQTSYRRPDPTYLTDNAIRNFGWSYYHAGVVKFTKRAARGLSMTASYTWSKSIDTGSEPTYTGVDQNFPTAGKNYNAARAMRGLSSYDTRHRFVVSYGYELPWYRQQRGLIGRVAGGWQITGTTTFQSGQPFTVLLGYDANLDGASGDRPWITDPKWLYRSIDNGRGIYPCPTVTTGSCPDTLSQQQVPGSVFIPQQAASLTADQRMLVAGTDGRGTIARNAFFMQGMNNFDTSFNKPIMVREGMRVNLRMEWYNLFNRVQFGTPARSVVSSTPFGRITTQRNPFNYVNSSRTNGSRMGQVSIRFIF